MNESVSAIDDEAANWVARMDGDSWSLEDDAELARWLASDVQCPRALLHAQQSWSSLDVERAASNWGVGAPQNRRHILMGGAAALAASIVAGVAFFVGRTDYQTDTGEIRRVPLADGSIAAINTNSRLEVKFSAARREVKLERGEAWFQVAKNPARPFVVAAGDVHVVAVGTAFSVRRRDAAVDVLVTEGTVRISATGESEGDILLTAGQRAVVQNAVVHEVKGAQVENDQALAWRNGKIDLDNERLSDAIIEFNRYNKRQIVLLDPDLSDERFDGVFRTDDVEGFALAVRDALGVTVSFGQDGLIMIGTNRSDKLYDNNGRIS